MFTSSWFDIREIDIEGNNYVSNDTIIKQGRLDEHINLFLFDTNKSVTDIIRIPWIADVYMKKSTIFSRLRVVSLVLATSLVLAAAGCGASPTSTPSSPDSSTAKPVKPIELSLAHFWPATHTAEKDIAQGWIKAVEEATNGQVKITSYPSETLLKSGETYEGVVKGVAEQHIGEF